MKFIIIVMFTVMAVGGQSLNPIQHLQPEIFQRYQVPQNFDHVPQSQFVNPNLWYMVHIPVPYPFYTQFPEQVLENSLCSSGDRLRQGRSRRCPHYPGGCKMRGCPRILRPVCGSDGITYVNRCLMKLANCKTGRVISIRHRGKCRGKFFIYKQ